MTDAELDSYFVNTLKKALDLLKDSAEYEKKYTFEGVLQNQLNYAHMINSLEKICKKIKSLDDLAELGEDAITDSFEAISSYAECFVISANEPQRQNDFDEYEKIEELLYLFCDTDEDDE